MSHEPTPNWQPINFLPKLAEMVDGMLESAEEVYHSLQQAQDRPHVMDDYTGRDKVGRRGARYLTARFSTPPVATVRDPFSVIR